MAKKGKTTTTPKPPITHGYTPPSIPPNPSPGTGYVPPSIPVKPPQKPSQGGGGNDK